MRRTPHIAEQSTLRVNQPPSICTVIFTLLLSCMVQRPAASGTNAPVGYALLVLADVGTNPQRNKAVDPSDFNVPELALVRVYGALLKAEFRDENLTILYAHDAARLDLSEPRYPDLCKRLNDKDLNNLNNAHHDATTVNVLRELDLYAAKATEKDPFVFWVCAHGWQNGALSLEGTTYLRRREMHASPKRFRSRSLYLLFDCCHSGAILERVPLDNALMFAATGPSTVSAMTRDFSNCARFLESLTDPLCDTDHNGTLDCSEAFAATLTAAREYDPILQSHAKEDRTRGRIKEEVSTTPLIRAGPRFVETSLFARRLTPVTSPQ